MHAVLPFLLLLAELLHGGEVQGGHEAHPVLGEHPPHQLGGPVLYSDIVYTCYCWVCSVPD